MLEEAPISIPAWFWAVLAAVGGALTTAVTFLFKYIIRRHEEEIAARDLRRAEDAKQWKETMVEAVTTVAISNERAMAQLGDTIGRHIKDSAQQQTKVVEALGRQLKPVAQRKAK